MAGTYNVNINPFGYIYIIENDLNDKLYIGQTTNLEERIRKHFHSNKKGTAIGSAIRKHGSEHFDLVIIDTCPSQEKLDEREVFWIAKLNTRAPYGYNLTSGGSSGGKHSSETIEKIRISKQGVSNPMFGKKHSPETKRKISEPMKKYFETRNGL